jgi:hypothetical protein
LTVTFSNLSLLTEDPVTYTWDFGDGPSSSAISPTHVSAARDVFRLADDHDGDVYEYPPTHDYIAVDPCIAP